MLYLSLIALVLVRLALCFVGPGTAAGLVLVALLTRRPSLLVGAALGFVMGLVPEAIPPPLDVPGTLSGVVTEVTIEPPDDRVRIRLDAARFDGEALPDAIGVSFALLDEPPEVGDVVRLQAELGRARAYLNPSPFPATPGPLRARGLSSPEPDRERGVPWTIAIAIGLRANLTFDDPVVTALHRALVLGERTALPPELRWAYQDTGLAHLLAISGFNLAVLGWGLYRILRRVLMRWRRLAQGGRPSAWAAGAALAFVGVYTLVILPSDATDRAMLALGLTLGATIIAREARGWRTLSLCFLVALGLDPSALMRPGFQLSFAATAALVLVAPNVRAWKAWLEEPGRVSRPWLRVVLLGLGAFVLADVAAFLATTPLSLGWFGQLAPHGLWLNLLAIPAMSLVVFPLALVAAFTGLDLGASWTGHVFDTLVTEAARLVGSTSTEAWPVPLGMLACVGVLIALRPGTSRVAGAAMVLVASVIACVVAAPVAGLRLTMLDVGHGDAIALRLPDGTRVLVDTGGARFGDAGSRLLAERVVVPALRAIGFGQIDLLVLSHADRDHTGAAAWLAARIPIGEVWLPPCTADAPPVRALIAEVRRAGGRVKVIARQPALMLGGVEVEVLSPAPDLLDAGGRCPRANDTSLVMRVAYAGRVLLMTGDAEADVEAELVARLGTRLRADILKAPHHGSKTSSTDAFLDVVAPSLVLVSGEPKKPPWPPHPAVLERYHRRGYDVRVTGDVGAIDLAIAPDGRVTIHTFGEGGEPKLRPP